MENMETERNVSFTPIKKLNNSNIQYIFHEYKKERNRLKKAKIYSSVIIIML